MHVCLSCTCMMTAGHKMGQVPWTWSNSGCVPPLSLSPFQEKQVLLITESISLVPILCNSSAYTYSSIYSHHTVTLLSNCFGGSKAIRNSWEAERVLCLKITKAGNYRNKNPLLERNYASRNVSNNKKARGYPIECPQLSDNALRAPIARNRFSITVSLEVNLHLTADKLKTQHRWFQDL